MPLESATYISDLVTTNPDGATDTKATLDDHIRLLKSSIKTTFPNVSGAVTASHTELNYVDGVTSAIQTQFDLKAPLASPTFTGTPLAPTAADGTNTTQLATTAYVNTRVSAAAMSATTPVVSGDAGKVWNANDGTTPAWLDYLKSGVMRWADSTDTTKKLAFGLSGFTTATTRTATWPDKDGTVAMTSDILRAVTLLATLTPTAAANVDALSTFSSTYDNYAILISGVKPAVDDTALALRFAVAGSVDAGANYEGATGATINTNSGIIAAGNGLSAVVHVLNANDASNGKVITRFAKHQRNATPTYDSTADAAMYTAANAISGVRFYWNGGANFAATGKIRIYGYNNT